MRVHRVLELENALGRTTLNCAGRVTLTRYGSSETERLSERSSAGNLAGKSQARFRGILNLFKKSLEFEFSPGHQIQILRTHY
jgi:hypothetical protein